MNDHNTNLLPVGNISEYSHNNIVNFHCAATVAFRKVAPRELYLLYIISGVWRGSIFCRETQYGPLHPRYAIHECFADHE